MLTGKATASGNRSLLSQALVVLNSRECGFFLQIADVERGGRTPSSGPELKYLKVGGGELLYVCFEIFGGRGRIHPAPR